MFITLKNIYLWIDIALSGNMRRLINKNYQAFLRLKFTSNLTGQLRVKRVNYLGWKKLWEDEQSCQMI